MTKQVEAAVVNRNAVNAIAGAITAGLREVNGTGSLLTQVCEVARRMYRGAAIPNIDVEAILVDLAQRMNWKQGRSTDSRRSEYRAVLGEYHTLPEATKMYRNRTGTCTWHNGIALARLLKKHKGGVSKAVAQYVSNRKNNSVPKTAGDAKASTASAIKRILKLPHLPRAFLTQLRDLCGEYGIKV